MIKLKLKPVSGNPVQSGVVENNDAICALGETLEGQQRVVRLNDDVAHTDAGHEIAVRFLVGKNAVSLNQLFGIPEIEK
jgi:hypothetical protein